MRIGFQEALVRQVLDLQELLGSDFAWVRSLRVPRRSFPPIARTAHSNIFSSFPCLLGDVIHRASSAGWRGQG